MASGGTDEETISRMEVGLELPLELVLELELGASRPTSTDENISAQETSENKSTCEGNSSSTPGDVRVRGETISSSKVSVPTRSINLYRQISSGGKQIHIQILAGQVPTKECQDTQAVVLCRYEGGNGCNKCRKVLQDAGSGVEVEYQAAKTEGGKYVSKGVILTSAGRNPGYLLHLTFDHLIKPIKQKETMITAL